MIAAAAMISLNSFSQDLIARQAPIDKKLKSVDSLALQRQIRAEQSEYPALSLYPNWSNQYVHAYGKEVIIPESYTIDLTGFHMPTPSTRITSPFGPRWRRMHNGLDLKVNIGDTIVAAFDGKVRIVRYERRGYGKYVVIRHDNGLETIYGHLSKQLVEENQLVKAGAVIQDVLPVHIFTLKPASWELLSIRLLCSIFLSRILWQILIHLKRQKVISVLPVRMTLSWQVTERYGIIK